MNLVFLSVTAFLLNSAERSFMVRMDLSDYKKIATEINYIGKNINSLVRRINTDGFYTDNDLDFIDVNQKKIIELVDKEYKRLSKEKHKYYFGSLSKKEKRELIEAYEQAQLPVPKRVLLEKVYEMIRKDTNYICGIIQSSPLSEDGLDDYLWDYMNEDRTLKEISDERLIQFSNDLFLYTEKVRRKMDVFSYEYNDDDWDELKEILDKYEIY